MPFNYIQSYYHVPARKGARVEYTGGPTPKRGTILSADSSQSYLWVRFDGETHRQGPFHPTWEMRYLPEGEDT